MRRWEGRKVQVYGKELRDTAQDHEERDDEVGYPAAKASISMALGRTRKGWDGSLAGRRTSRWRDPFLGEQAGLGGVGEGDYLEGGDGVS